MQIVTIGWECIACKRENPTTIKKPSRFSPTLKQDTCRECGSNFLLRFTKVPNELRSLYSVVRVQLSEIALSMLESRAKEEKQKEEQLNLETKTAQANASAQTQGE